MCMIALQPAGVQLSGNKFRNAWERNKDGGGYAFPQEDRVVIKKGFFNPADMLKEYRADVEAFPEVPFLIHFRISTSGKIDAENTHPHRVRKDMVIAHNGHIQGYGSKEQSDTLEFVNIVLQGMPERWEEDAIQTHLIERFLVCDKMVLLRGDSEYVIFNEDMGWWVDGIWYSNKSFEKIKVVTKSFNPKPFTGKSSSGTTNRAALPMNYTACGWDDDDGFYETAPQTYNHYLNQDCCYCDVKLEEYDNEMNIALDSWYPICADCIVDKEKELVGGGVIADAVTEIWEEVFDKDEEPATSPLLKPISSWFSK